MVTRTVYSDASMVVIDIGKTALPWRQGTTYLLDPADGRTTRTQAQTVAPTSGVTESNIIYPEEKIMFSGSFILTVITEATGLRTSVIGTTTAFDPNNPDPSGIYGIGPNTTPAPISSTRTTTTAPPATTTSRTSSTGSSSPPTTTILMGLAGGVFCLVLVGLSYYFYRRNQRRKTSEKDSLDSDDTLQASSPSTPSLLEKGKDGSYFERAVPDLMLSYLNRFRKGEKDNEKVSPDAVVLDTSDAVWDPMAKENAATEDHPVGESTTSSEYGSHAGESSSEGGYHETDSVMEERLYRLRSRNHSPPPLPPSSAGQVIPTLPNLPPLPAQSGDEVRELRLDKLPRAPQSSPNADSSSSPNYSDPTKSTVPSSPPTSGTLVESMSPSSDRKLTSILKAPPPSTSLLPTLTPDFKKWVDTVQDRFGKGPGPRYEPTFAEPTVAPQKKKGVTFGFEEVREFGNTPRASLDLDEQDDLQAQEFDQRGDEGVNDQESGTSSELGHDAEGLALKRAKEEESKRHEEEQKRESGIRKTWFSR